MRIALIAHDSRKELMAQFCTAYVRQPQKLTKNAPSGQVLGGLPKQYRKILVKQRAAVVL